MKEKNEVNVDLSLQFLLERNLPGNQMTCIRSMIHYTSNVNRWVLVGKSFLVVVIDQRCNEICCQEKKKNMKSSYRNKNVIMTTTKRSIRRKRTGQDKHFRHFLFFIERSFLSKKNLLVNYRLLINDFVKNRQIHRRACVIYHASFFSVTDDDWKHLSIIQKKPFNSLKELDSIRNFKNE